VTPAKARALVSTTGRRRDDHLDRWLVVAILAVLGPIVAVGTAQPQSRYSLTTALAEHGTVDLGGYPVLVDRALYDGELRSDKAPGQPLLAVPVFGVARLAGAEPGSHFRLERNLGLWWVTLWTALVPFAWLVVVMRRVAARFVGTEALYAALALGFGTIVLPHAVNLYGHVLAALFAFGAWAVCSAEPLDRRRLALTGLLAGAAVAVEYHTLIVAAVLAIHLGWKVRTRAAWFVLGGIPPALVLAAYQWAAFGRPWRTPFAYYAGELDGTTEGGYSLPSPAQIATLFGGERGLLFVSPIVLVALGATLWWATRAEAAAVRTHARIGLAVSVPYLLLIAGWSGTKLLEEPGPRYLIPAVPFLAVPLAASWRRIRPVATIAAVWGTVLMSLAATTYILVTVGDDPVRAYTERLTHGRFTDTLWSMLFGNVGWAAWTAYLLVAGAAVARFVQEARRAEPVRPHEPEPVAV
jgi:hypothetical protein